MTKIIQIFYIAGDINNKLPIDTLVLFTRLFDQQAPAATR